MNIVTATDYSVEFEIDQKGYQRWLETEFAKKGGDKEKGVSSGLSLKNYIVQHVEEQLTEELQSGRNNKQLMTEDDTRVQQKILRRDSILNSALSSIKVADVHFCFDNGSIIELLKQRGSAIARQNFNKVAQTEKQINDLINDNYDQLVTPQMCVITFEE